MNRIIADQRNELAKACRATRAVRLDVFGSAVREDFDPAKSDIDFLVEFADMPAEDYADAYFALKARLESLFRRSIDLVTVRSLKNPFFRARVEAEKQAVYAG